MEKFKPMYAFLDYQEADQKCRSILLKLSVEEKIQLIGGHNLFFVKGFDEYRIPSIYLSDATQGVHIRKDLDNQLDKSTAFPCSLLLAATWNPPLAEKYAASVGEECRAGGIAVLLGPGMNIYRNSQCGRNFEYFGEDPFLASRMIENYVTGLQSTGTIATLKHFLCNNTEYHRRTSNSIVDERTLHEIYLPAFKAGIDAGAMAVMTSYNQLNGEWTGQSSYVIDELLRKELGFKWLVMTDWWSVYDPLKVIKSGQDLEMPGNAIDEIEALKDIGDVYLKSNAMRLLNEGKISESDINRMAASILRTIIAMGFQNRNVKDDRYLEQFPGHEKVALETAREGIVLLKNRNNILPIMKESAGMILLTGDYAEKIARGGGSASVEGYNNILMKDALKDIYEEKLEYVENPSDNQIINADFILLSIGTDDSEGWDKSFNLPRTLNRKVSHFARLNPNLIVIVNSGSGINMTEWNEQAAAILYAWYPGQNGNLALAEIISGSVNPSGKLPITIEKKFEDSPAYPYLPGEEELKPGWENDMNMKFPITNIYYNEGVFVGYRWYDSKNIEPLYHFGHGLSYTTFEFCNLNIPVDRLKKEKELTVELTVKNTGGIKGAETVQLYIHDRSSSVPRPFKELKRFHKLLINPGESKIVKFVLRQIDFSFWDVNRKDWYAEPGEFDVLIGASSNDIRLKSKITLTD